MANVLSCELMSNAFQAALATWSSSTGLRAENLARVDPLRGFAQGNIRLTGFASMLFTELIAGHAANRTAWVTFRGIPRGEQTLLRNAIQTRHPALEIIPHEHLTLDFSLTERRNTSHPWTIRLAMESEMWPLSAKGADPEALFGDFTKLCKIHAHTKVFLCRATRGNEKVGGRSQPKLRRFKDSLRKTIEATRTLQAQPPDFGIYMIETGPRGPWRVHMILGAEDMTLELT